MDSVPPPGWIRRPDSRLTNMPRVAEVHVTKLRDGAWRVSTAALKPRYRRTWPSESEAICDADRIRRQLAGTGADASQLRAIDAALHRLSTVESPGRGKPLDFVVEWFLSNYHGDDNGKTIGAWATEYQDLKRTLVESKTMREIEQYVVPLVAEFGHMTPRGVSDAMLREYLAANTSPWHRSKVLRNFFAWLAGEECKRMTRLRNPPLNVSPFAYIRKEAYKLQGEEVAFLDVKAVRRAIEIAIKDHPEALPWFIFLTFTGVRPDAASGGVNITKNGRFENHGTISQKRR